ncbi:MAG: hypothetical protein PW788_04820 [Micavibrio sp.]|nr:hypothetical protein [Micavibrio sp.]
MSVIAAAQPLAQALPDTPRQLDAEKTFAALVDWIEQKAKAERAPGFIIGLSGTDSILTFLACSAAFTRMGKPDRVLGLNFEHAAKNEFAGKGEPYLCVKSPDNWVARDILPWLESRCPGALLEIDATIERSDDNKRWGHLFSRAVGANDPRHGLGSRHYFPVGTRNATEQALGTYSQLSKSVSLLPIVSLYKTEVLALCEYLGVPKIAIEKSREIDCDCGRFEVQANHMHELDLYIMHRHGLLSRAYLQQNIPQDVLMSVAEFYAEETALNNYRPRTPYLPEGSLAICRD